MAENKANILLIEDRPEDAELTMMALKKHNFVNLINRVNDGEQIPGYGLAVSVQQEENVLFVSDKYFDFAS